MSYKPIIIVSGDPKSIFLEIFFKSIKEKKFKNPIILICSKNLLKQNMRKFNFKKKIKLLKLNQIKEFNLNNDSINLIDVKLEKNTNINQYIEKCFFTAFKIIKDGITNKFINGPISKKKFLKKKYLGMTEYICDHFSIKKNAMLIYNRDLSVCPLTTHVPIKQVTKKITKAIIKEKVKLINEFYIKHFKYKPKIAILGLNPHCETNEKFNEDQRIIKPAVLNLKKFNYNIDGPYSADTAFLKQNRIKYDVIIGSYHDQVLTPLKTLFEYDAINVTLGLPFIRISPDHGPNEKMVGKNISNPLSLIKAISFLDKN